MMMMMMMMKISGSTAAAFTLLRDEFMHQMHKFEAAINVVKDHLDARVHLAVPSNLHLEDSIEENLANTGLLQQIEDVCIDWFKQVADLFQISLRTVRFDFVVNTNNNA